MTRPANHKVGQILSPPTTALPLCGHKPAPQASWRVEKKWRIVDLLSYRTRWPTRSEAIRNLRGTSSI